MSALAMILTAAMVVPATGPERVSGEVEQELDLRGVWEGQWILPDGKPHRCRWGEGELHLYTGAIINAYPFTASDKGGGNLLLRVEGKPHLGICRQDGNRLIICFKQSGGDRPTSFRAGDGQHLLILHRVNPRK